MIFRSLQRKRFQVAFGKFLDETALNNVMAELSEWDCFILSLPRWAKPIFRRAPTATPYIHAEIVKEVLSSDGKAKVDFLKRRDGFYEFRGYIERVDDGPVEGNPYWSPVERSGLYSSFAEAERSALMEIPWLRDQKPDVR